MPLSETQDLLERKFDVCFTHADVNGNGVLEAAHVLALAARIATYLGEPMGSTKT
jgi:hypothetical protein